MTTDKAAAPVGAVPQGDDVVRFAPETHIEPGRTQVYAMMMPHPNGAYVLHSALASQAARMAELEKDAARYRVARRFLSVAVIQGRAAHDCTRHADYLASIDAAIDALLHGAAK